MPEPLPNMRGMYYPADTPLYDRDHDLVLAAAATFVVRNISY